MPVLPTSPIVRLVAGGTPELEYRPPTMAHVRWWQDNVQPTITARYPGQGFDKWDWREFARFPGVVLEPDTHSLIEKTRAAVSRFLGTTVRLRWRMVGLFHPDDAHPLALIMYMPDVHLRSGVPRLHYLEYFVARPRDQHSFGNTKPFGKYIMDWLMMSSNLAGLDGRVGLHGASESLCEMYETWGFVRLDGPGSLQMIARSTIPHIRNRMAARASAALFCEINGERASTFCAQFNELR